MNNIPSIQTSVNAVGGGICPHEISRYSKWSDTAWRFDSTTDGQHKSVATINWAFALTAEERFTDPQWKSVLESLRWVLWSLLRDPIGPRRLKETSVSMFAVGARSLVRWMALRDIRSLDELTPDTCYVYIEWLVTRALARGDGNFTSALLYRKLHLIEWIYLYGGVLARASLPWIKSLPFGARSAFQISRLNATKRTAPLRPIPDSLAINLMNEALALLGVPAEDIIRLNSAVAATPRDPETRGLTSKLAREAWLDDAEQTALKFQFSTIVGDKHAWHPSLLNFTHHLSRRNLGGGDALIEVRRLVSRIRDAAIITIQSCTGMRANELCSLKSGINRKTGLPKCIEIRSSQTGLNELFFIKGFISKQRQVKVSAEWIAGLRPKGSNYLPPPVHAALVLERLLDPWRNAAESNHLLVTSLTSFLLPNGITRMTTDGILAGLRRFARDSKVLRDIDPTSVDYQDVSRYIVGDFKNLKTHQWRATWCHYIIKIDPRLSRDISNHLKHLTLAMTEHSYIGNDAELLECLDETRTTETARFFYEAATGRRIVVGSVAKLVAAHAKTIADVAGGESTKRAMNRLRSWILTHDLRIWFMEEGKCLINTRPDEAQCHRIGGTVHWGNRKPNYITRTVDTCLGCSCFATDADHRPFWRKRLSSNRSTYQEAMRDGVAHEFEVARARWKQAEKVIHLIDAKASEARHD